MRRYRQGQGSAKVMKPTAFEACDAKKHWEARLWGDPAKLDEFASTLGVMRSLPWYATWAVPGSDRLKTYYPDMSKHVDVWEYQGMIGQSIHYSYKPRNGIIKQFAFMDVNRDTDNTNYKYMTGANTSIVESNVTGKGVVNPGIGNVNINAKASEYSSKLIECYGTLVMGQVPTATFIQPSLHVGLQSVQSNAPDDGGVAPEFVNACAIWQIDSEIIISHDNDCLYSSTAASSYGRNGQCDFIVTGFHCYRI
ncbi:hypothetical protein QE152_g1136 [Popillia japonica]|uniref:Uncharacterized protein n=1 Tax=Popillia japonica TaxID=7064 RepID=A0AAW1N9L1_POPJA